MSSNGRRPLTVGVLALQGDFREHREMLERMGHHVCEIRKTGQLAEIDALIIPGGESTTIARLILSNGFQQPLREFCASGKPVWGTCAGAILLAKRVDNLDRPGIETMDISVHRNAFGRQVDSFEAALTVEGLQGPPFHAVFIRAPLIQSVAGKARAICRLEDGTIVPLDVKVGDRILFGKYSGSDIKIDGEEYLILREDEVLGILDPVAVTA